MNTNLTESENYIIQFTKGFAKKHFNIDVTVGFMAPNTFLGLGSCHIQEKLIRYNRTFINTHKDNKKILEYLAIHECCHFKVRFHDAKFKRLCKKFGMPHHRVCKIEGFIDVSPPRYYLVKCPKCGEEHKRLKFKANFGACCDCCEKYNGGKYTEDYRYTFIKYVDESKSTELNSGNT